ncbi:hypothetical protein ACVWW3_002211 [Bradyrhizobium sp. LM2.9]
MAHDVLDHDDCIVDHEAHRDRERHQREVVQAIAEHVQDRERADQRQGNRDCRNDGGPEIPQEEEYDHHHQCDRQHQRELNVGDCGADGGGPVGGDRHLDRGRNGGLQLRQQLLDAVDGLDDVGAGNALDRQNDGGVLTVPAGQEVVLRPLDRRADVAYPYRRTVAISDDEVFIGRWLEQLIVGVQRICNARAVERALGQVDIGAGDHAADVFKADAAGGKRLRIDANTDRGLLLAADADEANARHLRDLRQQDVLRVGVDRGQRQRVRRQRDQHDRRLGRVHLSDRRRVGDIRRQEGARRIDRGQHVHRRAVHRARQLELHRELGHAERTGRGELGDAGDLAELLFERRRQRRGDRSRVGAGQLRRDLDSRVVDVRQGADRQ